MVTMSTSLALAALAVCAIPVLIVAHALMDFRAARFAPYGRRDSFLFLGGVELIAVPFLILLALSTHAPAAVLTLLR